MRIIVKGAAKAKSILFLLGPILCKAKNNNVSPSKTPIIPDITIVIKNSLLIEDQVSLNDAYEINIIETIINLILLKPIPPKDLEISADIKDARDQQNAANRARK